MPKKANLNETLFKIRITKTESVDAVSVVRIEGDTTFPKLSNVDIVASLEKTACNASRKTVTEMTAATTTKICKG